MPLLEYNLQFRYGSPGRTKAKSLKMPIWESHTCKVKGQGREGQGWGRTSQWTKNPASEAGFSKVFLYGKVDFPAVQVNLR